MGIPLNRKHRPSLREQTEQQKERKNTVTMSLGGGEYTHCSLYGPSLSSDPMTGCFLADAKFPFNKDNGIPPSPSRENPGQVKKLLYVGALT